MTTNGRVTGPAAGAVRGAVGLALVTLLLHLPYLPASLEDLDSINFALGLGEFDVARHQPHPPGYPVYIAAGKLAYAVVRDEKTALSLVSVIAAAVAAGVLVLLLTRRRLPSDPGWWPAAVATLAVSSPLFWMTAVRPLSDMLGLAVVVLALWAIAGATTAAELAVAALVAGVGVGVRSQVVWLTLPLLVAGALTWERRERRWAIAGTVTAYGAGALLWAVPLIVRSGGLGAYLQALASQGGEDFAGVAMLATQPSARLLIDALYATWIAPWGHWLLALPVLVAAVAGVVRTWRVAPGDLLWLGIAFGPYGLFHLVFQETATTRYALPLVLPVAFLAARGVSALPGRSGLGAVGLAAAAGLVIAQPAVRAYATVPAPAFQVLEHFAAARTAGDHRGGAPVLAMHRRQELDMRRPLQWVNGALPDWSAHLPAPPKHEWLELVKYWNAGGRAPVWYLADPPRSDLRLIDRHSLTLRGRYRWPFDATAMLGGVRPNVMDWYEIGPPRWYAGEGWALTPETAGVAREDRKGPGAAPIHAWVRRQEGAATLMIGGRKLAGAEPTPVTVAIDGRTVWSASIGPGFFLHFVTLSPGSLAGSGDYADLTVTSGTDEVAIEQFDLQPMAGTVYGYGDGWQELEYDPNTGRLWRWTTERATLRMISPRRPLVLHLDGTFETSAATAHVVIRSGERVVAERHLPPRFVVDIPIPADAVNERGETAFTIESDQWYVPADTNWRPTEDRRHLALRLFAGEIR